MDKNRSYRARTQEIYLVRLDINDDFIIFHILGSTKRVYKITFKKSENPKCSCPDHAIHRHICKHILFVLFKILNMEDVNDWFSITDFQQLSQEVQQKLPHLTNVVADAYYANKYNEYLDNLEEQQQSKKKDVVVNPIQCVETILIRNTDCCVCLCELDQLATNDIMLCATCQNGIHKKCWNQWVYFHKHEMKRCVYCRTLVNTNLHDTEKKVQDSGWGILIE